VYAATDAGQSLSELLESAHEVTSGDISAKLVPVLDRKGRTTWSYLPGSITPHIPPTLIEPEIAWTTRPDGTRELQLGHDQLDEEGYHYRDRMLGFLTVGYLQPSIRKKWKSTWPNPNQNRRPQGMGVAQIPVFVLMPGIKKQLLNSSLLDVAELSIAYA